jgi:hypothetical protein
MRCTVTQLAVSLAQNVGYLCLMPPEDIFKRQRFVFINNLYVLHIAMIVIL